MALKEHPLDAIRTFLPEGSFDAVADLMHRYPLHLKIKKERRSVLGDFRPAPGIGRHTISVNGNLNTYHFLITLLHEIAHMLVWEQYRNRVKPHGLEWKHAFAGLLRDFLLNKIFPKDIEEALNQSLKQLAASTCSDPDLFKVLHRYDKKENHTLIEHLAVNDSFQTHDGRIFRMIKKRRTRFECEEISTGRKYLFPGIYEVSREY
jgi:hypothetical protein